MRHTRSGGFTLVELMITVAIIGVLAVVAGTAYRKYMVRGRVTEVAAMFAEFRAKEEAFRLEANAYRATGTAESALFPALASTGEPKPKALGSPIGNADWVALGINPQKSQLYCGYVALAGAAGTAPSGKHGLNLLGTANQPAPWFYLYAQCDNDGKASTNMEFSTAMNTTNIVTENDQK